MEEIWKRTKKGKLLKVHEVKRLVYSMLDGAQTLTNRETLDFLNNRLGGRSFVWMRKVQVEKGVVGVVFLVRCFLWRTWSGLGELQTVVPPVVLGTL
jgi:hypothetical protein